MVAEHIALEAAVRGDAVLPARDPSRSVITARVVPEAPVRGDTIPGLAVTMRGLRSPIALCSGQRPAARHCGRLYDDVIAALALRGNVRVLRGVVISDRGQCRYLIIQRAAG